MFGLTRYVKKSLVENPYITVTAAMSIVGLALPTFVYFNGGREKEAAMRFNLIREMRTDPRIAAEKASRSSDENQETMSSAMWAMERRRAAGL